MDHVQDVVDHVLLDAQVDVPEMVVVHVIIVISAVHQHVAHVIRDVQQWV